MFIVSGDNGCRNTGERHLSQSMQHLSNLEVHRDCLNDFGLASATLALNLHQKLWWVLARNCLIQGYQIASSPLVFLQFAHWGGSQSFGSRF